MTNTSRRRPSACAPSGTAFPNHRGADGVIGAAAVLDDHLLAPGADIRRCATSRPITSLTPPGTAGAHYGDGLAGIGLGARRQAATSACEQRSEGVITRNGIVPPKLASSRFSISLCPSPYPSSTAARSDGRPAGSLARLRGLAAGRHREPAAPLTRKMSTYSV